MDVCLIEVPFMAGDGAHPAAEGPGRYLRAGAQRLVAGGGIGVTRRRTEVRVGTGVGVDVRLASRAVNLRVRALVQEAAAGGQLPVVLAGSCDVCMGVLAGLDRSRCGVVWIDAHADFNTPESSISGFRRALAIGGIDRELADNKRHLADLVTHLAPQLLAKRGVGPVSAAQAIVSCSHPGRCPWESPGSAISEVILLESGDLAMIGRVRKGIGAHAEKRGLLQDRRYRPRREGRCGPSRTWPRWVCSCSGRPSCG